MKRLFNFLLIVMSSFFLLSDVYAVETFPLNNFSYTNYLNLHNLQFDNREIAQRYYNFFLNNNLHDLIFVHNDYFNTKISNNVAKLDDSDFNNKYFISLLGLETDGNNNYDFRSGIRIRLYLEQFDSNLNYSFSTVGIKHSLIFSKGSTFYGVMAYEFNLVVDVNGDYSLLPVGEGSDFAHEPNSTNREFLKLSYTRSDVSQFLSAFYESNFYIPFDNDSINTPFSFNGISFYDELDKVYTSKDFPYLGHEYFDNNLMFGSGVPLYPGSSYFHNEFEFDIPYTSDFNLYYISSNKCYLSPTQFYFDNLNNFDIDENYNLFFNANKIQGDGDIEGRVNVYSFYDSSYLNSPYLIDTDFVKKYSVYIYDDNDIYWDIIKPELLSDKGVFHISPFDFVGSADDQISSGSIAFRYNKNYYNLVCGNPSDSSVNLPMYDGSNTTIDNNAFKDDSNKDDSLFGNIVSLFNRFVQGITNFLSMIISLFDNILTYFSTFFEFLGLTFTMFMSSLPSVVFSTFVFIFEVSALIIILNLFL